jgi:hypothetical protein
MATDDLRALTDEQLAERLEQLVYVRHGTYRMNGEIELEAVRRLRERQTTCEWLSPDNEAESAWSTSCGRHWEFMDGGPLENRAMFCMGCGRMVAIGVRE